MVILRFQNFWKPNGEKIGCLFRFQNRFFFGSFFVLFCSFFCGRTSDIAKKSFFSFMLLYQSRRMLFQRNKFCTEQVLDRFCWTHSAKNIFCFRSCSERKNAFWNLNKTIWISAKTENRTLNLWLAVLQFSHQTKPTICSNTLGFQEVNIGEWIEKDLVTGHATFVR